MKKTLPFLLAIPFLVVVSVHAQDQSQEPSSTGASQTVPDCSDPLMSESSQCTLQLQGGGAPTPNAGTSATPGMPGTQGQNGLPQSQSSYYLDNESLYSLNDRRNEPRMVLPAEPLTEFQKFVASTAGQVLPIYGADLFREVPSTFAPIDEAPVPQNYIVGPGDELRIRIWGQFNSRADVRVSRDGDIYLPQIGPVHVAGLPFSQLDQHLRAAVGRVYRNFDLTVDVGQIRAMQVYLAGAARRPGEYTVSSLSTLVDALFSSGGPSATGSLRHIELRRGGEVLTDFDLYALLLHGDKSKDVSLQSGDVIFIPPVGPQVALTGSVRNPAIYELRQGETLKDLVADAGGSSVVASQTRISIERIDNHRDRYAMEVAYDQAGMATELVDGDLIRIYSILPTYQKTVTLRGNTANPGRFAWHAGMRVSDLIPDKQSLITRNYWWKRSLLGLPSPEFEPLQTFPRLVQPTVAMDLPRRQLWGEPAANAAAAAPAPTPSEQPPTEQSNNVQYESQSGPGPAPAQGAAGTAAAAQAGTPTAQQAVSSSSLAVQQQAAQAQMQNVTAAHTEVGPIAPEIDWNYAVIERLDQKTLKTVLLPFDLGRLVQDHDESQDLALEPGDVVTVFSQADIGVPIAQQTKFVRLDGEFMKAGVYTVEPGETLRDLVRRAGGFTANAYLYGSQFTRESARVVQQRRLDEYVQTLALEMQRNNLALVSSPVSSAQDLTSAAAAQTSEQLLLSQLRQMRASGRIVLEFRPGSTGIDSVPNIPLENGDRFVVPSEPASINVVGAVYDQNSFVWEKTRRAGAYLRLAGGPNRDADTKRVFVIRADGSVVSRADASGLWGNQFDSLAMNPGDTIVVPDKSFKPSAIRGFLDWSQTFSQLAFGAAALSFIQ